ncbi:two-component response regulator ARR9-like isoform X2 [Cornus florida]|uniref:two-component response regulator ARR9-like isoform X2 n=1 Tax=Cornus florida TaxID=4283 RepID=UPI0028984399|nr:two-component response regulator ARR9-like isoform X2 [Cornus florida]
MGCVAKDAQFHVLAVDDSLIDRKLIERLLKTSSYRVTALDSGNKALEFLGLQYDDEQRDPTSVIPNNHTQESTSMRDVPVVIMSSENVPSRINRCLEGGAEEFFLKPVQLSDVNKLRPHLMREKTKEQLPNNDMEDLISNDRTRHNDLEMA